jgi:hypothetical protein
MPIPIYILRLSQFKIKHMYIYYTKIISILLTFRN